MTDKLGLPPEWVAEQLATAQWHTASSGGNTCVQVAFLPRGIVAVGDSKNQGAALLYTDDEWNAFCDGIVSGKLRRPL
jgi:hypothetical protein